MTHTILLSPPKAPFRKKHKPSADRRFRNKHVALLNTLGWQKIPNALLRVIASDLELWNSELTVNSQTIDQTVRQRRSAVRYWVKAYQNQCCSLKTAIQALS